jgi:hypothetical protein
VIHKTTNTLRQPATMAVTAFPGHNVCSAWYRCVCNLCKTTQSADDLAEYPVSLQNGLQLDHIGGPLQCLQ